MTGETGPQSAKADRGRGGLASNGLLGQAIATSSKAGETEQPGTQQHEKRWLWNGACWTVVYQNDVIEAVHIIIAGSSVEKFQRNRRVRRHERYGKLLPGQRCRVRAAVGVSAPDPINGQVHRAGWSVSKSGVIDISNPECQRVLVTYGG